MTASAIHPVSMIEACRRGFHVSGEYGSLRGSGRHGLAEDDAAMTVQVTRLDARDLICPIPVLKARKALNALPTGAVLEVLATDPAAPKDFASFCEATGNVLLSAVEIDGATLFRIEKTG